MLALESQGFNDPNQAHLPWGAKMTPLIVVPGIAGAVLILAGLAGGDSALSGRLMPQVAMPKIGNWVAACVIGGTGGTGTAWPPVSTDKNSRTVPAAMPRLADARPSW